MLLVDIVLPIFLLIILGWLLTYFKFVPNEIAQNLMIYLFWAAGPAIIFLTISSYHISQVIMWRFWVAYSVEITFVTILSYYLFRYIFHESKIVTITSAFSTVVKNTVIIGFPVLMGIAGQKAAIPMAITVIIFNCFVAPVLMFMLELNAASGKSEDTKKMFLSAIRTTFKNPLVLSAFLGIAFSVLDIHLPFFLKKLLLYLALSFVPCALFAVGAELRSFRLEGNLFKIFLIASINLLLCPIIAVGLCYALDLSPFYAAALVIFSSVPTAKSMYIYVSRYPHFAKEVSAIISVTTVCSMATIPIFIYLSYWLWPSTFKHLIL